MVVIVTLPHTARAEINSSLFKDYTLTVGVSAKEMDFDYYRHSGDSSPSGTMTEGMYFTYLLRAGSPYVLIEGQKVGYYFETGISDFSMSKQNVGDEETDLGTSVAGRFWYVMPVGFYVFGPLPGNKKELSVLAGAGIGIGYLDAKGDMLLTEDGSNELHQVDTNGVDIAVSVLIEAHYNKWVSRIYGGGPLLDVGESTYSLFDFVWDFGYTHSF